MIPVSGPMIDKIIDRMKVKNKRRDYLHEAVKHAAVWRNADNMNKVRIAHGRQ